MNIPLPLPIVSVRDVLPTLGFTRVWGTATDLEPAYEFKGGGIDGPPNEGLIFSSR